MAVRASTALPADVFNDVLSKLLEDLRKYGTGINIKNPRIMITGSVMDNPRVLGLIEECGANVVTDDLCTGTRQFWNSVEGSGDPLTDLSRHYLGRTPCPRMKDAAKRIDHILDMIDKFKVDGIILYTMKFCDPFLFEVPWLKAQFAERNLPALLLEGDYTPGTLGRAKLRIEAFIEMLRQGVKAA
jgi:benzoyl-CoA reductase/2-hydroxyglutaryl-CoA dehydratase subunit BcrC/BadD/HgdB